MCLNGEGGGSNFKVGPRRKIWLVRVWIQVTNMFISKSTIHFLSDSMFQLSLFNKKAFSKEI